MKSLVAYIHNIPYITPLAVRLQAHESGFKLIAEGHELGNFGDEAAQTV